MTRIDYFSGRNQAKSAQTLGIIENVSPKADIRIHTTIETFSKSLRQYHDSHTIAVILTATYDELLNILLLKDLLKTLPILLILPDDRKDTVAKGALLQPRFICQINDDLSLLYGILMKMTEKYYG